MFWRILVAVCLASGLAAPALAQTADKPLEKPLDKAVLMLNWFAYGEHAPFVLGRDKGFYKDEGIDLEIQEGRGSSVTVQAVAAGTVLFGLADVSVMMKAATKGAPVKSVGVLLQRTPAAVITPEGKIKNPKDIVGKTIAITPGDALTPIWPLYLKKVGLADGSFRTVAGDAQTKLNAVVNGQADGLIGFTTEQGARLPDIINKPVTMLRFTDAGVNLVSLGIVANHDTIKNRGDLVRRFMRATTRAVEAAMADPKGAVDLLLIAYPKMGLPDAQLRSLQYAQALYSAPNALGPRPFQMNPALITDTLDVLSQYGGLSEADRGKVSDYYTAEFLP
ncbi:ABC transporter substrate-binding protein [Xanthobacter oligotrophicus]|uniref:ABC transporter substrate-binding protein n=1 Tax=Xanthobacter oligotrophicus TaxID=2607286 RepID=UPI0011F335B9|nr:ABC transporter substrate-binding protein [Xanthobacter oligotrophicus]MCG5235637.1 ABC transporter substrate-binding protein [Xanthobacter oligotrophicus]